MKGRFLTNETRLLDATTAVSFSATSRNCISATSGSIGTYSVAFSMSSLMMAHFHCRVIHRSRPGSSFLPVSIAIKSAQVHGKGHLAGARATRASHAVIIRSATAFWRHPGDDLVGVGDVTSFAVD